MIVRRHKSHWLRGAVLFVKIVSNIRRSGKINPIAGHLIDERGTKEDGEVGDGAIRIPRPGSERGGGGVVRKGQVVVGQVRFDSRGKRRLDENGVRRHRTTEIVEGNRPQFEPSIRGGSPIDRVSGPWIAIDGGADPEVVAVKLNPVDRSIHVPRIRVELDG